MRKVVGFVGSCWTTTTLMVNFEVKPHEAVTRECEPISEGPEEQCEGLGFCFEVLIFLFFF
jgi:hypothetical protein